MGVPLRRIFAEQHDRQVTSRLGHNVAQLGEPHSQASTVPRNNRARGRLAKDRKNEHHSQR
jgi:hypothetical protein